MSTEHKPDNKIRGMYVVYGLAEALWLAWAADEAEAEANWRRANPSDLQPIRSVKWMDETIQDHVDLVDLMGLAGRGDPKAIKESFNFGLYEVD